MLELNEQRPKFRKFEGLTLKVDKMQHEKDVKMSANAVRKARHHRQRVIGMLYCTIILAIGLSISLYCTLHRARELDPPFVWFFTCMYMTSIVGMLYTLVHIYCNRNASIEAIEGGHFSAKRIMFSMRGEPVNLYLRIGTCIFAILSITFAICRAVEVRTTQNKYELFVTYTVSEVMFFVLQTAFLLLLHRLVILHGVHRFTFILLHLLTVNLTVWVESAVEKISRAMATDHGADDSHERSRYSHYVKATGYFLPAIPEYCAIAVAILYEMLDRIGQLKQIEAPGEQANESESAQKGISYVSRAFAAILCLLVLGIVLFLEIGAKDSPYLRNIIHLSEISTMHLVALILSIVGICYVRKLKFSVNFAKNRLDGKLLLVTFFVTVNFLTVCIVLCIVYLSSDVLPRNQFPYMCAQLASIILELIQVIVQTYFIHDMFYRCCHHELYQRIKPGRNIIVILSALNFALWMIYSFQIKHNDVLINRSHEKAADGDIHALYVFIKVSIPMVMLFRYHSSVCLAIAYVRIYEDEVSRYESMLRWIKEGTTSEIMEKHRLGSIALWTRDIIEVEPLLEHNANNLAALEAHVKCPSTEDLEWVDQADGNDVVPEHSSPNKADMNMTYLHTVTPKVRRNTQLNWDLARIRVKQCEKNYRNAENKLRQYHLQQQPNGQQDTTKKL